MTISESKLQEVLQGAFPKAEIKCTALASDDNHWEVFLKDDCFNGKSLIIQHKMVQESLKDHDIHALSIKTQS
ncbi:MAG: stress-induced morphogen [Rickettsiales bacterium]|jgi:stress-induced morphogen